ncbi:TOBE domain-containing protein [Nitratifractor sp.]
MNRLEAEVTGIEGVKGLTLLELRCGGVPLRLLALSLPEGIGEGSRLALGIKATRLALASAPCEGLSLENRLPVKITSVRKGQIVALVGLDFAGASLEALLPRTSFERTGLEEGEEGFVLFGASDLAILEVLP